MRRIGEPQRQHAENIPVGVDELSAFHGRGNQAGIEGTIIMEAIPENVDNVEQEKRRNKEPVPSLFDKRGDCDCENARYDNQNAFQANMVEM